MVRSSLDGNNNAIDQNHKQRRASLSSYTVFKCGLQHQWHGEQPHVSQAVDEDVYCAEPNAEAGGDVGSRHQPRPRVHLGQALGGEQGTEFVFGNFVVDCVSQSDIFVF